MAVLLKGAPAAAFLKEKLLKCSEELSMHGITPKLAIIRIGVKPSDKAYERSILKNCESTGVEAVRYTLDENCKAEQLYGVLRSVNDDSAIHGCILMRPLADKAMESMAVSVLAPSKDSDSMTQQSCSSVYTRSGDGFAPCTAEACMELLKYYNIDVKGMRAVVIGRSYLVGRPLALMLLDKDATVTICHTKTKNLPSVCREADLLVCAAGHAGILTADCVRPGQIVLDVGTNTGSDGKLTGDVCFDEVSGIVDAITPVPGGVGVLTSAVLCSHVIEAAQKASGCKKAVKT